MALRVIFSRPLYSITVTGYHYHSQALSREALALPSHQGGCMLTGDQDRRLPGTPFPRRPSHAVIKGSVGGPLSARVISHSAPHWDRHLRLLQYSPHQAATTPVIQGDGGWTEREGEVDRERERGRPEERRWKEGKRRGRERIVGGRFGNFHSPSCTHTLVHVCVSFSHRHKHTHREIRHFLFLSFRYQPPQNQPGIIFIEVVYTRQRIHRLAMLKNISWKVQHHLQPTQLLTIFLPQKEGYPEFTFFSFDCLLLILCKKRLASAPQDEDRRYNFGGG